MSAQVGTLQRTGFPRMIRPALAIMIVIAGITTAAVLIDDRTSSQTSSGSQALTAEAERLTAQAEAFEGRSVAADAARLTAVAVAYGWTGDVVHGVTTPTELRGGFDSSTTGAPDVGYGPIGFHPLP